MATFVRCVSGMYYGTFFSNNVGDIECPAREQAVAAGNFVYTPDPTLYQHYSTSQVGGLDWAGRWLARVAPRPGTRGLSVCDPHRAPVVASCRCQHWP